MIEEIKKELSIKIQNRIEIMVKPETKAKLEPIKKYRSIVCQNIVSMKLSK